jgi:hypothetical protein
MPSDCIELYDNALDRSTCHSLIERFEQSSQAVRGKAGSGLDLSIKDSWDIDLTSGPGWQEQTQLLNGVGF